MSPSRSDTVPREADGLLLAASAAGELEAVRDAISAGAALEARDARGRSPLLLAVAEDHVDVAVLLIECGADPDAVDDQSDTPWLVTGVTGSVAMLEVLLPAGPDLARRNRYGGYRSFQLASVGTSSMCVASCRPRSTSTT